MLTNNFSCMQSLPLFHLAWNLGFQFLSRKVHDGDCEEKLTCVYSDFYSIVFNMYTEEVGQDHVIVASRVHSYAEIFPEVM